MRGRRRARSGPLRWDAPQLLFLFLAVVLGPVVVSWRYGHLGTWVYAAVGVPATVSLLVVAHLSRMVRVHARLEHETNHDQLTGLPNRAHFNERIGALLDLARETHVGVAVMFVDLDRFKKVNDTLGHGAGDELLVTVSARLRGTVGDDGVVARLSGDEFGVLARVSDRASAVRIAEAIVCAMREPFELQGRRVYTGASVGVALYPEHGQDVETLLQSADSAMYRAKARGRNVHEVYSERMRAQVHQQVAVEEALTTAISGGELAIHYQPKFDVRTGAVNGMEALVRWYHPTLGLVSPNAFIRLAEETGLVGPLGEWVLRQACTQAAAWRSAGREVHMSVNLSARQFQLQNVSELVADVLAETGLPPHLLELELTETAADDTVAILEELGRVRRMGVRCSLDDFGTGFSSLGRLTRYTVDTIKIDKSFILSIDSRQDEAPLVRAIIAMAHSLGIQVVAEGVETEEQLAFLAAQGCDLVQGFLLSRPLTIEQAGRLLAEIRPPLVQVGDAGAGGDLRVLPLTAAHLHADQADVTDEEMLGLLLWTQESARHPFTPLAPADEDSVVTLGGYARSAAVVSAAACLLASPLLAGLGAAGALPPHAQRLVSVALGQLGVPAPDPENPAAPLPVAPGTVLAGPATTLLPPGLRVAGGTMPAPARRATGRRRPHGGAAPAPATTPVAAPGPAPSGAPGGHGTGGGGSHGTGGGGHTNGGGGHTNGSPGHGPGKGSAGGGKPGAGKPGAGEGSGPHLAKGSGRPSTTRKH